MRPNFLLFILLSAFLTAAGLLAPIYSYAQESELIPYDTLNFNYLEEALMSLNDEIASQDLMIIESKGSGNKGVIQHSKAVEQEEDSILSFNFLYYIIRKFKASDLID